MERSPADQHGGMTSTINIFRVANGKIVERWGRLDDLWLLQQRGLAQGPVAPTVAT